MPFVRSFAAPLIVFAFVMTAAGCGSGPGAGPSGGPTGSIVPTVSTGPAASAAPTGGHLAPELEARLPDRFDGVRLSRVSTIGPAVFGGDAWSNEMTGFLEASGRTASDFRFAQAWDPTGALQLEAGVFAVDGVSATALRDAIVAASRPNAPGLTVDPVTIGGKATTAVVYPGGDATLYLYDHDGVVYYLGTGDVDLAARYLAGLP